MTGKDLREQLQFYVDDEGLSATRELLLINQAYQTVCTEKYWNFLVKEDSSNTLTTGTTSYSLPTDFVYLNKVYIFDPTENNYEEVTIVPFQRRMEFQNTTGYCYIDSANNNIIFLSPNQVQANTGKTLVISYQYMPEDIEEGTEPVFNKAFHRLLALEGARIFWLNDQQEDGTWSRDIRREYDDLKNKMIEWDNRADSALDNAWDPPQWVDLTDSY